MSNGEGILQKFFAAGNSYWLTRFVILRLLGFIYAIAFLVAANQLVPLIGEHGLTPGTHFLNAVQTQLGSRSAGMLRVPTLLLVRNFRPHIDNLLVDRIRVVARCSQRIRERNPAYGSLGDVHVDCSHRPDLVRLRLGNSAPRNRILIDLSLPAA